MFFFPPRTNLRLTVYFPIGAFVAAPVGGLIFGFLALFARLGYQYLLAKRQGRRFDALDKPRCADNSENDGGEVVITRSGGDDGNKTTF